MIDFESLRLPTNFNAEVKIVKELTTIIVRKPKKLEFIRVRKGPEWVFDTYLLDMNEEDGKYLVAEEFRQELLEQGLLKPVRLFFLLAYGTGVFFLSDIILPDAEGKINPYNKSRLLHYQTAKDQWIKIVASQELGVYNIFVPKSKFPEPEWPTKPSNILEAVEIAFRDRFIETADHPVLKKIRGEV